MRVNGCDRFNCNHFCFLKMYFDKRSFEIKMTSKGLVEQQKLDQLSTESVRSVIASLSAAEKQELAQLFERLMRLLYQDKPSA